MGKAEVDNVLYFELSNGAAGDMIVGALLDSFDILENIVKKVNIELSKLDLDLSILAEKKMAGVISAVDVLVKVGKGKESIDAEKVKDDKSKTHHHHHRGFNDIKKIIEDSKLEDVVKFKSINIFRRLGEAEAKIHGKELNDIHFHEVGALDTIGDVVASVVLLRELGVTKVVSSPANLGTGVVHCAHGKLNLPAPAALEILKKAKAKCNMTDTGKEIFTPTAAAIITEFTGRYDFMPEMALESVGYGTGKNKINGNQNTLRVVFGKEVKNKEVNKTPIHFDFKSYTIEVNIDDMNPEHYEYLSEMLFDKGAADVCIMPIMMKKNRPGSKIIVICQESKVQKLINIIFKHSTTTGVRFYEVMRQKLEERFVDVILRGERIQVKHSYSGDILMNIAPEYDDCKRAAKKLRMPLKDIYSMAIQESKEFI